MKKEKNMRLRRKKEELKIKMTIEKERNFQRENARKQLEFVEKEIAVFQYGNGNTMETIHKLMVDAIFLRKSLGLCVQDAVNFRG
ncbi:MAG: hypothetical protein WCI36_01580 [bacterium]